MPVSNLRHRAIGQKTINRLQEDKKTCLILRSLTEMKHNRRDLLLILANKAREFTLDMCFRNIDDIINLMTADSPVARDVLESAFMTTK